MPARANPVLPLGSLSPGWRLVPGRTDDVHAFAMNRGTGSEEDPLRLCVLSFEPKQVLPRGLAVGSSGPL